MPSPSDPDDPSQKAGVVRPHQVPGSGDGDDEEDNQNLCLGRDVTRVVGRTPQLRSVDQLERVEHERAGDEENLSGSDGFVTAAIPQEEDDETNGRRQAYDGQNKRRLAEALAGNEREQRDDQRIDERGKGRRPL